MHLTTFGLVELETTINLQFVWCMTINPLPPSPHTQIVIQLRHDPDNPPNFGAEKRAEETIRTYLNCRQRMDQLAPLASLSCTSGE